MNTPSTAYVLLEDGTRFDGVACGADATAVGEIVFTTSMAGYQEAILLDAHGFVCEGSGENIYAVRGGQILTPPQTAGILDGINRKSIIRIAGDLGLDVVERDIARAELYLAEEVFMSGTAAELVPVREIDDHAIGEGEPGPITRELARVFDDALHGRDPRYTEWLDLVQVPSRAG